MTRVKWFIDGHTLKIQFHLFVCLQLPIELTLPELSDFVAFVKQLLLTFQCVQVRL